MVKRAVKKEVVNKTASNKDILLIAQSIANERGVEEEVIFEAIEVALAATASKRYLPEMPLMRVSIDRKTGDYSTFRLWEVVMEEEVALREFPEQVIVLAEAQEINPEIAVGDF